MILKYKKVIQTVKPVKPLQPVNRFNLSFPETIASSLDKNFQSPSTTPKKENKTLGPESVRQLYFVSRLGSLHLY